MPLGSVVLLGIFMYYFGVYVVLPFYKIFTGV